MRRRIFQGLVLAVLGLFAFDCAQDAASLCDSAQADACHACFCGPHLAPQGVTEIVIAPVPVPFVSYEPSSCAYHLPSSIFRPPCLAA
ncbi:MAG: hypothetical protein HYX59_08335 [Elusimicrobia bacterium]|nr:hypothetical protein [Elusimicrobiota bacterium]